MEKPIEPVGKGYSDEMQRIVETYSSFRDIDEYRKILGFSSKKEFLAKIPHGALLLDVGSGENKFSEEMKKERPDVKIFNLNPASADYHHRSRIIRNNRMASADVAGINPGLPYADASFDVVLDCMASIYRADKMFKMTKSESNRSKFLEIVRVLKPGGFAAVGPLIREDEIEELLANSNKITGIVAEKAKIIELNFQSFHIRKLPL